MKINLSTLLKQIYFDPTDPGADGGVERLYKRALELRRDKGLVVTRNLVRNFLDGVQAYTLHGPIRHAFARNHTYVSGIDKQWQADLADMQSCTVIPDDALESLQYTLLHSVCTFAGDA